MKRVLAGLAALLAVLAVPAVAHAHNAGHIILPDGTCLEIGSFKSAPIVGKDRTQLDLVPETPSPPFDEIGASFVGHWGRTPILPGPCGSGSSVMSSAPSQTTFKDTSTEKKTDSNTEKSPSDIVPSGPFYSSPPKPTRRSLGRERF